MVWRLEEITMNDEAVRFGRLKEECGVFGIFNNDEQDVARLTYYGLYALQHRGQESAGIAVNDGGTILYQKDMGLVPEIFNDVVLNHLKGKIAIGHVRYSTTGASFRENAQPMIIKYKSGQLALAHNGNLVNAAELRNRMEENGAVFQSSNDTEVIANLIARYRVSSESTEEAIQKVMKDIRGSFALVILTPSKLIGIRDAQGIRPLCIGKLDNSFILASESCALDAVGAKLIRDVKPGEIVTIDESGIKSFQTEVDGKSRLCIFEFVYFARPDSYIDGASVHQARIEAGRILAKEHPVDADLVIGAPDGGLNAALGFSRESGIPYGQGLLKNKYVGRTFIQPDQDQRESGVRIKFNAIRNEIEGKRIVMVDDSIVRGTTTRRIVQMLKDAGAKEVHMRVSSPPYKYPCYFGIDISSSDQLLASSYTVEEIRAMIGADSLGYLSLEGLLKTPLNAGCGFCTACFNADYPMEVPEEGNKFVFARK
jgi:amidophosphoribosyltransferase